MKSIFSLVTLSLVSSSLLFSLVYAAGPDPSLRKFILRNYDKVAFPGDGTSPVVVEVPNLFISSIDIDEKDQAITAHGWLWLQWTDTRLVWSSDRPDNSGYLHFSANELWKPDLSLFNSANQPKMFDFYGESELLAGHNGSVTWIPPVKLRSSCVLNLRRWPYDTQTCEFILGSWTYDESTVNVTLSSSSDSNSSSSSEEHSAGISKNDDHYINNTEWTIVEMKATRESKEYDCCPGLKYVSVHYSVTVQRKSSVYSYTVVLPILMITLVNIIIFLLPATRGEKLLLGCFNFLVVSIFLIYFHSQLPVLSNTPLMVMLFGVNLFFISEILALSVLVLNFTDDKTVRPPPKCTHIAFNKTIAAILCLKSLQKITNAKRDGRSYSFKSGNGNVAVEEVLVEQQPPPPKSTDNGIKAEWYFLAAVVDRIALIFYVVTSLLLFVYVHV